MTGCYEHSQHNCCKFLCQWQHWLSLMKKRLVQAELKHLLSLWSYSTQNFPATRKKGLLLLLWASHAAPTHIITYILLQPSLIHATTPPPPPTPPQCMLVPCYLKQHQSATKTTCYSSGFLASHPKISPQSCQLTMLLPRKISASTATIRVWPVFPTAIWSQRLSPTRHESLSCNSVKMRSLHPPCSRLLCGFFQEL